MLSNLMKRFFVLLLTLSVLGCGDEVVVSRHVLALVSAPEAVITAPPESVWNGIRLNQNYFQREDGFEAEQRAYYTKYIDADGIAILASARVADEHLLEAWRVVLTMTAKHPALRDRLRVQHGFYMVLFKYSTRDNNMSFVPEFFGELGDYGTYREQSRYTRRVDWQGRYIRGVDCISGMREEYFGRMRTFTHEFAHALDYEMERLSPGWSDRVKQAYQQAKASDAYRNLWAPYIVTENSREYFAEGVVIWYYGIGEDREFESHEAFAAVDPLLYGLLSEWFYQGAFSRDKIPGVPQYNLIWEQKDAKGR